MLDYIKHIGFLTVWSCQITQLSKQHGIYSSSIGLVWVGISLLLADILSFLIIRFRSFIFASKTLLLRKFFVLSYLLWVDISSWNRGLSIGLKTGTNWVVFSVVYGLFETYMLSCNEMIYTCTRGQHDLNFVLVNCIVVSSSKASYLFGFWLESVWFWLESRFTTWSHESFDIFWASYIPFPTLYHPVSKFWMYTIVYFSGLCTQNWIVF